LYNLTIPGQIRDGKPTRMARYLFLVIFISAFLSFFRLGSVTLFDVDEAVFAEATKEMVQSGDWITPTYNGENRYDKPILFYWLMGASYEIFGINEFAARLVSAVSGVLLSLCVFLFVRQFCDERRALYASLSLCLSIFFLVYSHAAVTDMVLTLFITLSLFSFYLCLKKDRRFIYGFYFFSALAFLTKGLIGIIFPFGIGIIYLLMTEGLKAFRKLFVPCAIALFLIVSLPWYITEIMINGGEFIQNFFIKHHLMRYTGVISGHKGPVFYYLPVLIAGLFPWIGFLPAGIRNIFRGPGDLKKFRDYGSVTDDPGLFACIWLGFIFVFFSFSTTKLPNYILPAIPAASILISSGVAGRGSSIKKGRLSEIFSGRKVANIIIAVLSAAMGIAFLVSRKYLLSIGISDTGWVTTFGLLMFAMACMSLFALFTKREPYGFMAVCMIIFLFLISVKVVPVASDYLQGSLYRYSLYARDKVENGGEIIAYKMNNPSIVFYTGQKIIDARTRVKLLPYIKDGGKFVAITKARDAEVLEGLGFKLLEKDGRYALLERR
jgi:4-amino-4-deoxy-L-arabinose transferase-like glycosyltransferase